MFCVRLLKIVSLALFGWLYLEMESQLKADEDWLRFRGPNGSGASTDTIAPPTQWSENQNLRWKFKIPGNGLSSPIVVGDRVFVTCWSGYAIDKTNVGDMEALQRHLICVDRETGLLKWQRSVDAALPEDKFEGMFMTNGYASHTPVSDGQSVFAFFGKSGVFAFDLSGKPLWQASVGTNTDPQGWGSAASPVQYRHLLIVNASSESKSLVALDKFTGQEKWRYESDLLASTSSTPVLVRVDDERTDLVISVPGQMLGLDPVTGKRVWNCRTWGANVTCASPFVADGVIYLVGGRSSRAIAVKAGGKGDISRTHTLWREFAMSRISTPLMYKNKIYWVNQGTAYVHDAATGKMISRLKISQSITDSDQGRQLSRGETYSSPVIAGNKMVFVKKSGHAYVFQIGDQLTQLAQNRFASDLSNFSATPAISNGQLFIRSQKFLYCISEQ